MRYFDQNDRTQFTKNNTPETKVRVVRRLKREKPSNSLTQVRTPMDEIKRLTDEIAELAKKLPAHCRHYGKGTFDHPECCDGISTGYDTIIKVYNDPIFVGNCHASVIKQTREKLVRLRKIVSGEIPNPALDI